MRPEGAWGPLDAEVRLPSPVTAGSEPLVVTGRAGKGDVVFVSYVDRSHIRFGFDHWSVGGPLGPVLETDFQKVHHLQVSMASMYPPAKGGGAPADGPVATSSRRSLVRVSWDDRPAFDAEAPTYAVNPGEIVLWANPIGASSCGPRFTGTVLESDATSGGK